jgi:hypothetical protein
MNKVVCALYSDTTEQVSVMVIYWRNTWFLLRPSHLLSWLSFFSFSFVLLGKCQGSTAMKPRLLPYIPSVFSLFHRHCAVWVSQSTAGCTHQQMYCTFIGRMHTAADVLYIHWQDAHSSRCTVHSLAGCTLQQMYCTSIGRMHTAVDVLYIHWQDAHIYCTSIGRMHTAADALYIHSFKSPRDFSLL